MTILKTLLLVFVSLFSFCSYGQTGKLSVITIEDDNFIAYLYENDSLIQRKSSFEDFNSLKSGTYKLIIVTEKGQEISYFPIIIREGYTTEYEFDLPYISEKSISDTIFNFNKQELSFNFLTNLKTNDLSPLINRNYQLGFSRDVFPNRSKHLSWGILSGSSLSYTDFKNDTSYYSVPNLENERYFSWNIDVSLIGRISFFDMRKDYKNGGYLDLGIGYHFPLLFKHVYSVDNRKFITNKLHNYKNITPLVRIGYNSLAFTYQYQLYDYVDSSFPQNPKHSIGISLVIDE